ncbi:molybdopterin-dependent oxidoreductase [Iodobacter sp. HSC-16F04]|uniref:Molybdopterin-dependent oxidoreductase n=1 Tax=Iodobacter violaceini TaxID=3044271 RepID=A0ABX0KRJ9_9NEIS|nr:molybdopterin-dependent oxidoreductase [Iodobacter violacea]NHQ84659.1 molybdopterin-dependent oxidoreductase [Iodobacter violacea]
MTAYRVYLLLVLLFTWPVLALDAPAGKVILTISGKVGEKNAGNTAVFDLAMLEKLPQQSYRTQTPWEALPVQFSGPYLRDVLAAARASGSVIKAVAVNDYKTEIPFSDTHRFNMILAHKMNGQSIPARTKGPLFIVYPYDTKPELQTKPYYDRSAWQVKLLVIE